jgi:hypothetical protein
VRIAAMIAAGLLVAVVVGGLVARRSDPRVWWQVLVGAVFSGCIVGMAVGDLLIKHQGRWWADRPMLAAGISAILLLGLTVLVVEAVIEHGNTLRRRTAAQQPVARTLESADDAHAVIKAILDDQSDRRREDLIKASKALEGIVVRARTMTPLLTASTELLPLYKQAEAFADAAYKLRDACRDYGDSLDEVTGSGQSTEATLSALKTAYLLSQHELESLWVEAEALKFVASPDREAQAGSVARQRPDRSGDGSGSLPKAVDPAVARLLDLVRGDLERPRNDGTPDDARLASFDLLIERHRLDAEREQHRILTTETRSAAIATVAVGLGTLVITQAEAFRGSKDVAYVALALLMATVVLSVIGRVAPRIRLPVAAISHAVKSHFEGGVRAFLQSLRTPSQRQADAATEVLSRVEIAISEKRGALAKDEVALVARTAVLAYWRARACSDHHGYNAKARWVVLAALTLAIAIILLGWCGIKVISSQQA